MSVTGWSGFTQWISEPGSDEMSTLDVEVRPLPSLIISMAKSTKLAQHVNSVKNVRKPHKASIQLDRQSGGLDIHSKVW